MVKVKVRKSRMLTKFSLIALIILTSAFILLPYFFKEAIARHSSKIHLAKTAHSHISKTL